MNAKEAKDFLVQQTAEQAALDGVSLSELEKKMMYFVENDVASCPNPIELNDEFESHYDTDEYEAKIRRLLQHAYMRLKREAPEKARGWDEAMGILYQGDHYLPVMWPAHLSKRDGKGDPGQNVIRCGTAALIIFGVIAILIKVPNTPSWVFGWLGLLLSFLCFLTIVFLLRQGYLALRRRKPS